jgi:hypothetical protein
MSLYKNKYNPISQQLNLVPTATIVTFKSGVANAAALPLSGNTLNDGRITSDTNNLYVWDGLTWVNQGDLYDLTWAALQDKPSSSVTNIDDSVSKRHSNSLDHSQGTDQGLDTGGTNAVTAAQAKTGYSHSQVAHAPSDAVSLATVKADTDIDDAIDKKHSQGTDQGLDTGGTNAVTAAQAKAGYSHSQVAHAPSDAVSLATVKADTDIDDAIDKKHASGSDDQDLSVLLKLDQVSPQTIINGIPLIDKAALDFTLPAQLVNKSYVDSKDATVGFAESYIFCEDAMFGGVNASPLLYSSSKTYALNEVVISSIGLYWRSLQAGNINQTLAENTWWTRAWHELEKKSDGAAVGSHTAVTTSYTEMDRYVSAALATTVIPEGIWSFELFSKVSASNKTGQIKATIYRISSTGAILATLGVAESQVFTNTIVSAIDCEIFIAGQTGWNLTDRIGVIISGKSSAIMTWYHDIVQGWVSIMNTPIVTLHNQLAGLNEGNYQHLTATEKSTFDAIPSTLVGDLKDISLNIMLNAFRIAQIGSLTIFNMVKGFMDEYEDESGIDLVNSINQLYNGTDDYYSNQSEIDSYTKSLLHCDGTNGSQIFTDEIGKTVTANGNAQLSTSIKKFGTASLYCPASGDSAVISAGGGSDFNLPYLTDFTIDWWEYRTSGATFATAVMGSNGGSFPGLILGYYEGFLKCCISGGSGWDVAENKTFGSLTLNVWKHYALTCESGTYRTFQDGVKQDEWVKSDRGIANMPGISLGGFYNLAPFSGYIDEFRFSKGIARWTSDFTPPSGYYAFSGNITLLSNVHSTTIVPTSSRIILFEEDVDSITLNTDIKAYVSRNNGTTFSQVTLEDEGNYITGARILSGLVDISGQPSGSNLKYKIESLNDKILKIHGTGVSWK